MNETKLFSADLERPTGESGVSVTGPTTQHAGMGGAYEGAERMGRELASWNPVIKPADGEMTARDKMTADARGRDLVRNSGLMQGATSIHKDSIVGSLFRLNAKPNYKLLGLDKQWAVEFAAEAEAKFLMYAESQDNWLDAARMNGLTMQVRLAIAGFFAVGEVLSTVEWLRDAGRPFNTAFQMIDPDRLSNPYDTDDSATLRRGVERNQYGAPQAYHIRMAHPNDQTAFMDTYRWKRVPIRKPWGRLQVIHLIEQNRPDQTRGVAEMVSVLKEMRMTKKFHEITLQNAIVGASFAATIESDLPPDQAFDSIGAHDGSIAKLGYASQLLQAIAAYTSGARNLEIDGVKIPHLFPGTKLNIQRPGSIGGVGEGFEQSLLRYVASALGLSYEQFSRDYTKTNYSSARASMNETWKYMQSRKKVVADRYAGHVYSLWLEEAINKGQITSLPRGFDYYAGQNKDAISASMWIGASRGQIDELKETQAAVMRIKAGLSTYEIEASRLGFDFRDLFEQQASEKEQMEELGLSFNADPTKDGTLSSQRGGNEDNANGNAGGEDEEE
jgi:lambda family phage portal protein